MRKTHVSTEGCCLTRLRIRCMIFRYAPEGLIRYLVPGIDWKPPFGTSESPSLQNYNLWFEPRWRRNCPLELVGHIWQLEIKQEGLILKQFKTPNWLTWTLDVTFRFPLASSLASFDKKISWNSWIVTVETGISSDSSSFIFGNVKVRVGGFSQWVTRGHCKEMLKNEWNEKWPNN